MPSPPNKRKRGGDGDIPLRYEVKKRKGLEKLQLLLRIDSEIPTDLEQLCSGARSFYFTILTPVLSCFRNYFGGDYEAFIRKWPLNAGISSFKNKCCSGSASTLY